uniref:Uncharacterized protein n=1 Tax=Arundo donax TaxID=35708 RepID=A0A0A9H4W8_ARUDO
MWIVLDLLLVLHNRSFPIECDFFQWIDSNQNRSCFCIDKITRISQLQIVKN